MNENNRNPMKIQNVEYIRQSVKLMHLNRMMITLTTFQYFNNF